MQQVALQFADLLLKQRHSLFVLAVVDGASGFVNLNFLLSIIPLLQSQPQLLL